MASPAVHTATKLVEEPWFIEGRYVLSRDGTQIATVVSVDEVRLEHRTSSDPETWEIVFEDDDFSSLQVLDDDGFDDTIAAGLLAADPDDDPPAGRDQVYMLLAICTIEFTAAYGGDQVGKVFRRPWRIPASALTAPAD
jgi:hypothetical protein